MGKAEGDNWTYAVIPVLDNGDNYLLTLYKVYFMTTILKSGEPIEELRKKLDKAISKKTKGVDTSKYSGILKSDLDPLEYQKKMRDEWE